MLATQSHFVQRVQSFKQILCNELLLDPHVAHGADQLLEVGAQAGKLALDRLQPMLRDDAVEVFRHDASSSLTCRMRSTSKLMRLAHPKQIVRWGFLLGTLNSMESSSTFSLWQSRQRNTTG